MSTNDHTYQEFYDQFLAKLRDLGANDLVRDVERTVARGAVFSGEQTQLYRGVGEYRPMEPKEALAVALEFLVTTCEVPLMVSGVAHVVENKSIEWRPERPGTEREDVPGTLVGHVDPNALRPLLMKILEIASEFEITMPEVT